MSSLPFVQSASWIWSAEATHATPDPVAATPSHYQVRLFRRTFECPAAAPCVIHVSADSRYLFYCNGTLLGRGPAKGDVNHHFYETFDLGPWLRPGRNVLAALVLDMSRVAHRPALLGAPCSVMTYAGGFVLAGAGLDTDSTWKVAVDSAHRFQNESTTFEGYQGYFEHRVSRLVPAGWTEAEFDDAGWAPATVMFKAERLENRRDPASPYGLVPRMIPMLTEGEVTSFTDVFIPGGGRAAVEWAALVGPTNGVSFAGETEVIVPPHTETEMIFDAGELTTAFPRLTTGGGEGSVVRLIYAEALR
ncbi:MAG: hypothetical protein WCQ89_06325, partial [Verrucomicrobiota bacterium]